jgi:hypothetical protein
MPSRSFDEYRKNLRDVHRLVFLHQNASGTTRGKRGLGHLTRAGLLLLCAAWERYVETVLIEGATYLTTSLPGCASLPAIIHQKVVNHANNNSTPWSAADLLTPSWAQVYLDAIARKTTALNTPKYHKIQGLFHDYLGIADIGQCWSLGSALLDRFVVLRGEVAHRGAQSRYVHFSQLLKYEKDVTIFVKETDNYLSDQLRFLVYPQYRPWNRIS